MTYRFFLRSAEIEAVGLARAAGYEAQQTALGREATAVVNAIEALGRMSGKLVPEVLSISTNGGAGGTREGVAATLMSYLHSAVAKDESRANAAIRN
ncbi:MAG: hypothetical protein AABO58_13585 [Acidobacteriota bacterium]